MIIMASGIEFYYDNSLRDLKKLTKISTNFRYKFTIYRKKRVENSMKTFNAKGAAAVLLDANNASIIFGFSTRL